MKRCAVLLPDRVDRRIWPFEDYFPGRLAIPMIEALATGDPAERPPIRNRCIEAAVELCLAGPRRTRDRRLWENVARDIRLNSWRRQTTRTLGVAVLAMVWLCALLGLGLYGFCALRQEIALLKLSPPYIVRAGGQSLRDLQSAAGSLWKDIEARYPAKASGLARALPWNWEAKPSVPEATRRTVGSIVSLSENALSPLDVGLGPLQQDLTALVVSPAAASQFLDALRSAQEVLRRPPTEAYLWLTGPGSTKPWEKGLSALLALAVALAGCHAFRRIARSVHPSGTTRTTLRGPDPWRAGQWLILILYPLMANVRLFGGDWYLWLALAGLFVFFAYLTLARVVAPLPRNPYMRLIHDLQPSGELPRFASAPLV